MAPSGSRATRWPYILLAVMALLALLLIPFQTELTAAVKDLANQTKDQANDGSEEIPHLPRITTAFRERPVLEDLSPAGDDSWERMALPRKGGFLWVEYNETSNEAWGISMFHALHCLKMLRLVIRNSGLMKSVVGESDPVQHSEGGGETGTLMHPDMDPVHIGHCVGYIAQHLICAADSTIEPPKLEYNDNGEVIDASIDGEGYQHQCRDASLLWSTAAKSEDLAVKPWDWAIGDTVESVFGAEKND